MKSNEIEKESLKDEMRSIIEEARMVLPGIQALFGFQTVAVFNNRFEALPASGMWAHLIALGLLALSIVLVMAPASYHRLAERGQVSRRLTDLTSNLITLAMLPLLLAFALDVYVVLLAALGNSVIGTVGAVATAVLFLVFWFLMPLRLRRRNKNRPG